jgi:acetyl-CoA carboxylase biotin carboxyl carrier protein
MSSVLLFLASGMGGGILVGNLDIDVEEVKRLVDLVEKHHLEELTVEHADVSVTIKGKGSRAAANVLPHGAQAPQPETVHLASEQEPEEPAPIEPIATIQGNIVDITAPLVGVFYRSPTPDAPSFVEVGDMIEVGSEVGLIEAMKVFSPIPSEIAGEIVEIPGPNGKLVREGDVLVRVRLAEE